MHLDRAKRYIVLLLTVVPLTAALLTAGASPLLSGGEISGTVLDSHTGWPIPGIGVELRETGQTTQTDEQGRFCFSQLSEGEYNLRFSGEIYHPLTQSHIQVTSGQVAHLSINLTARFENLREDITVTASPLAVSKREAVSTIRLEGDQADRIPGSFHDISRILKTVTSASHISQKSNDLIVRGGSPWENGFYIDNIQVPNLNHFQSQATSGGVIGVLDTALIEDLTFQTGGFSAAYGNRMSAIVDIRFREGSRDRILSDINLDLTGFGGRAEGPLWKRRGSWLLSLQRSYYDVVANLVGYGIAPRFGDLHVKLVYDLNSSHRLTFLNISGDSRIRYDLERAVEAGFNSDLDFTTRQNTIGLNWFASWGSRGYSNTSLSYANYNNAYSATGIDPESTGRDFRLTKEISGALNLRHVSDFQTGKHALLEFGAELKGERLDFSNSFSEYLNRWQVQFPEMIVLGKLRVSRVAGFATWRFNPLEPLSVSLGMRAETFSYNRHVLFSPRLSFNWSLSPRLSLRGAWGVYYQTVPLFLLAGSEDNRGNADPRAHHLILGLNYRLGEDFALTIDFYRKSYSKLPLTPDDPSRFVLDSGMDFSFYRSYNRLLDTGLADCRGVEILLQKKTMERLYGLISLSLFRSRFQDVNAVWRNRINDNRCLITALIGYRPDERWGGSLRWHLAGGIPYTPFDLDLSTENNRAILAADRIFMERYPSYMTLDLRVERRFRWRRTSLDFYLGVINLLNRRNIEAYFWNRIDNGLDTIEQVPILPVFGATFRF